MLRSPTEKVVKFPAELADRTPKYGEGRGGGGGVEREPMGVSRVDDPDPDSDPDSDPDPDPDSDPNSDP